MKRLLMLVVAGTFSLSAAAYACDGMKQAKKASVEKDTVAKKEAAKKGEKGAKGETTPKS